MRGRCDGCRGPDREKRISYGEALSQLGERLFAEFWSLPREAYERMLAATARWVDEQPEGRSKVEVMAPHVSVQAFRKPLHSPRASSNTRA
jgi:hypothetical protein